MNHILFRGRLPIWLTTHIYCTCNLTLHTYTLAHTHTQQKNTHTQYSPMGMVVRVAGIQEKGCVYMYMCMWCKGVFSCHHHHQPRGRLVFTTVVQSGRLVTERARQISTTVLHFSLPVYIYDKMNCVTITVLKLYHFYSIRQYVW